MIAALAVLSLVGFFAASCPDGDWQDFNYGLGDCLRDGYGLQVNSAYNAEAHIYQSPQNIVNMMCGVGQPGCAYPHIFSSLPGPDCVVILSEESAFDIELESHELNHCQGHRHE